MNRSLLFRKAVATCALATAALVGAAFIGGPIAGAVTHRRPDAPATARILRHRLALGNARVNTIGTTSFTVLARSKIVTVDVLATTRFRIDGRVGAFGDLSVGSEVRIFGIYDRAAATLNAFSVDVLPTPKVVLWGPVRSTGPTSFQVMHRGQLWTVDVTPSTKFRYERGPFVASAADVAVGDTVRVFAQRTTTAGTVNALFVTIFYPLIVHFTGFITSIGTNSFTVLRGHENVTVDVSSSTSYRIAGTKNATFADLAVGDPVNVNATRTSTAGLVTAYAVSVVTQHPHPVFGEITSVAPGVFTIVHRQMNLIVDVTATTQYFQLRTGSASFGDLATGDRVLLSASPTGIAGTVDANWVLIF